MLLVETETDVGFVNGVSGGTVVYNDGQFTYTAGLNECRFIDDLSESNLTGGQIRWLFANECATKNADGTIDIDWDKARKKGFDPDYGSNESMRESARGKGLSADELIDASKKNGLRYNYKGKCVSDVIKVNGSNRGFIQLIIEPDKGTMYTNLTFDYDSSDEDRDEAMKYADVQLRKSMGNLVGSGRNGAIVIKGQNADALVKKAMAVIKKIAGKNIYKSENRR